MNFRKVRSHTIGLLEKYEKIPPILEYLFAFADERLIDVLWTLLNRCSYPLYLLMHSAPVCHRLVSC